MRKSSVAVLCAVLSLAGMTALNAVAGHRVGGGFQYDFVTGDGDDGVGGYGMYEIDLSPPIAAQLEVSYSGGDFSVPAGEGDYAIIGVGAALVFVKELEAWTPYFGAGVSDNFVDFDGVDYDDKVGIYWLAGGRVAINEAASADFSLRYRGLQPDSRDLSIDEIDMNAIVVRVGLLFEL